MTNLQFKHKKLHQVEIKKMKQGRVYFPPIVLPPRSTTNHRIIVLSNDTLITRCQRMRSFFLLCAIIRSAINQNGNPVIPIPGHSIPVSSADFTSLVAGAQVIQNSSIIETHQLFHVPMSALTNPANRPIGDLEPTKLEAVLAGARRVLN